MHMPRGPVRVTVYQARIAMCAQRRVHRGRRDIHDLNGLLFFNLFALGAHVQHLIAAGRQRLREKFSLVLRVVRVETKRLVFKVIAAQRVAMHQQRACAV